MKRCFIVGAGDFSGFFTPTEEDFVIAADGGYDHLKANGIRVDLLVGDFDSVSSLPDGVELVRFKKEKDETDMHLSYLEGKKRGYTHFEIYGGSGGRADHTFANYCLLSYIKNQGDAAYMHTESDVAYVLKNEESCVFGKSGDTVSVFAFGGDAVGVDILGLEYEVENATLNMSFPLGVSNKLTDKPAKIRVRDGELLIIQEKNL